MERRVLLAVVLSIGLIYLVQVLFPSAPPPARGPAIDTVTVVDSAPAGSAREGDETGGPPPLTPDEEDPVRGGERVPGDSGQAGVDGAGGDVMARITDDPRAPADTIVVRSDLYEYAFSTRGAALVGARLQDFDSYAEEDSEGRPVELVPEGERFFAFGIAIGGDTVRVGDREFSPSTRGLTVRGSGSTADGDGSARDSLTFTYEFPGSAARFVITYRFRPDGYLVDAEGRVEGLEGRGYVLLTELGTGLRSNERNHGEDRGQFAVVTNGQDGNVENVKFGDIESGEMRSAMGGPFRWVAVKSKYFLVAAIAPNDGPLFGGATIRGTGAEGEARISTSMPVSAGNSAFRFGIYMGPQDYGRLNAIGQDLQDVNSFGYEWLQPVFRPLVAIVMPILVWMHTRFNLAYGWVLILFGVMMRVVLFPLYQKSMRAQIGQMRVQPIVQDIRERHKNDPQKMQQEMMRIYKEEGVNPFAGCLPMLVPMPILFTLFFVFQGTIEFRGVPFLWLPDLSLKDPLYIIPVVMGLSMFLLQWIGQRSMTQTNTQMKAMMYGMPLVLTFLFANFPSGLNLYYTTSNLASLPQQLYIARERKAAGLHDNKGERRKDDDGGG